MSALDELNETVGWRDILGILRADRNQKDVELVLRLFSLFESWNEYEKPMLKHLNRTMDRERNFESDRALRFKKKFPAVVKLVNTALVKPFRPRGVINSAVLEAVLVTLLENKAMRSEDLKKGYNELLADQAFLNTITGGTTDTLVLKNRLTIARKRLTHDKG